ncbi:MAG: inorganic diphosphatase [Candidatus Limnocylindria bacterium]
MPASATSRRSVDVVVEIPRGSRAKYEMDHRTGRIRLDRVLYSSVHYPADYGYIEGTLAGDGDPLDVLVVVEEPTFPGCLVEARPIGTLITTDKQGEDQKILAVPLGDPRLSRIRALRELAPHWLREIETFFATYKMLERDVAQLDGWRGPNTAWRLIEEARARHARARAGTLRRDGGGGPARASRTRRGSG